MTVPALVALLLGVSTSAAAEPEPDLNLAPRGDRTVLLVRTAGDEPVVLRLRAEFDALGWHLIERRDDAALDRSADDSTNYAAWIRQTHASAALRVLSANAADLWVIDEGTGGLVLDRLTLSGHPAAGVLAVRAIETLRARLNPSRIARLGSREARPDVLDKADSPPPSLWIGVGPALSYSPGGVGALGHGALSLRYELPTPFVVALFAWAPLLHTELTVAEGDFELRGALFGGTLGMAVTDGTWGASVGVGLSAALLDVTGHAEPPYQGVQSTAVTTLPTAIVSGSHQFATMPLRLRADAFLGYALPRASIHVRRDRSHEEEVASWGAPLLAVLVGVDVGM